MIAGPGVGHGQLWATPLMVVCMGSKRMPSRTDSPGAAATLEQRHGGRIALRRHQPRPRHRDTAIVGLSVGRTQTLLGASW